MKEAFLAFYYAVFYQPLFNILIVFYETIAVGDLGLSIIFLTVLIRVLLYPVFKRGLRAQFLAQELQPKLKKIREEHRENHEKQIHATLALYREYNFNPLSPFFILLAQLPVMIALYQIIFDSLKPEALAAIYPFLPTPSSLNNSFLGLINLTERNTLIAGVVALIQYFQMRFGIAQKEKKGDEARAAEKTAGRTALIVAGFTFFVISYLPVAVNLYIAVTLLFSIFQQLALRRSDLRHGKLGNIHQKNV